MSSLYNMEKKLPHSNYSFEDEIKNKLQDFEVTPSPHMWNRIESELHPSDSKPKGIFWLQNKILISGLGLLLFVGFSSIGSRYVIKNMLNEYQVEKEIAINKKPANLTLINNINKNNVVSSNVGSEVLTSENSSTLNKVGNYLQSIIPTVSSTSENIEGDQKAKQSTATRLENTNVNAIHEGLKTDNQNSSLFSLIKMNVDHLNQMSSVSTISPAFKEEGEVSFIANIYHLKGIYFGPDGGGSVRFATKNFQMSNPIIGSNIGYAPALAAKVGLVLGYNINNKVAMESRISYLHQNQKFESYKYDTKAKGDIKLTYIEIPLNVKYKINQLSHRSNLVRSVNLSAGLQYAYLAQAKLTLPNKISRQASNSSINPHDYISNHQLGFDAGVDYDLFISKNVYWTIGMDGSIMGDIANKYVTTAPSISIGVHTGIRFFSGGNAKVKK